MKDGKYGFDPKGMTYGSDANFDGKDVGYTAMPLTPVPRKTFGKNSGWPRATGETEMPGDLSLNGREGAKD